MRSKGREKKPLVLDEQHIAAGDMESRKYGLSEKDCPPHVEAELQNFYRLLLGLAPRPSPSDARFLTQKFYDQQESRVSATSGKAYVKVTSPCTCT